MKNLEPEPEKCNFKLESTKKIYVFHTSFRRRKECSLTPRKKGKKVKKLSSTFNTIYNDHCEERNCRDQTSESFLLSKPSSDKTSE